MKGSFDNRLENAQMKSLELRTPMIRAGDVPTTDDSAVPGPMPQLRSDGSASLRSSAVFFVMTGVWRVVTLAVYHSESSSTAMHLGVVKIQYQQTHR